MSGHDLQQARSAAGMQTARLSDGHTAYCVHGERGPWVVLVHGLLTPSFAWKPLADELAGNGFRVLRYDHFGRGFSDRPLVEYDLARYVLQLAELTRSLGIERMHLVGWSLGALISTRFAFESPASVRSLGLIAPALFMQWLGVRLVALLPGGRAFLARRAASMVANVGQSQFTHPERFPDYVEQTRQQMAYPGFTESLVSSIVNFRLGAGPEMRGVGDHERPVLVVWGDRDPVTPYANAKRVLGLFPRARLLTVKGAKHGAHLDHAAEVYPELLRHLREAEGRPAAAHGADVQR